jgi:pyrroline-5-carboxylate reductase
MANSPIAIVGCGNMGMTYARAFHRYGRCPSEDLYLIDKRGAEAIRHAPEGYGQHRLGPGPELQRCGLVVVAVKPQDFEALAPALKPHVRADAVVLSVMAGIPIQRLQDDLGCPTVVRAMPNLPAQIGHGMTAFVADPSVSRDALRSVESLLETTGRVTELGDEALLDAVTAISGSGPAYFFFLVAEMIRSAQNMGLEPSTAQLLVQQTMMGAYHLLQQGGRDADAWIQAVSSKGGTTEAAFEQLRDERVAEAFQKALEAARTRAQALST